MSIKQLAATATFILSLFSPQANASQTWTFFVQGTIEYGFDTTGVFGTAGQVLTGMPFSQTVIADVDPANWQYSEANAQYHYTNVGGYGPAFTQIITVNGNSVTFNAISTINGGQILSNAATMSDGFGSADAIQSNQTGNLADGSTLFSHSYVYSTSLGFIPTISFSNSFGPIDTTNPSLETGVTIAIYGVQSLYFYSHKLDSFSVTAVPEPETYAMLLAGLGLVGGVARCRKLA